MTRQFSAILLVLCMLFSTVPCLAGEADGDGWGRMSNSGSGSPEEAEMKAAFNSISTYNITTLPADGFKYKYNDDQTGVILTSYLGEDSDVVFPETVDGTIPVVAIDTGMCADNGMLISVRIPGSIKTIGNNAFARCANLKSIVIEEGVAEIGQCSFGGCPELVDVKLPDSLLKVGNAGFAFCAVLEEVAFGASLESIGAQAFAGCASLVRIIVPGGDRVNIPDNIFDRCPNEVEIVVP